MRSEPSSASPATPFGTPNPDGTLVREVALDGMAADRPVQYALHAVRRGPTLLLRATCLACGASQSDAVPADDPAFATDAPLGAPPDAPLGASAAGDDAPDAVAAWGESFADAHDAAACLPTFDGAAVAETIEQIADARLGAGADAFLDAVHQLATTAFRPGAAAEPAGDDALRETTTVLATPDGVTVHAAERAALTLAHLPGGGPDLAAYSAALAAAAVGVPPTQRVAAVAFPVAPDAPTVRRWMLCLPDRCLGFETRALSADDVELAPGASDFVPGTPGVALDPMRVQAAVALTQVAP